MKRLIFPTIAFAALAACSTDPALRYAVPAVPPEESVAISYRSVEVREIILPTYAQLEEIFVETEEGALTSSSALLWADDPSRASTQELTRALAAVTGAQVASEPWPFDSYPQVRVELRVDEFIASRLGAFRLSGQAFIATLDGVGRDRAIDFAISIPLAPDAGPREIAAARGQAMAQLATRIARDGLR
ncbi:membrane integrity-associated transporter subunit PqiC [Ponticoccus sp. SC2-23]|uniref:PqiC family protein n=1 Tax=Alexandriicola marinus TaxID=2081710 RepID=UPI000FD885A5|nr:ABC-type transport auxiliary lipoprotein family protein [Alexandriicola marinus]MBM1219561.1 membrane integrity-associated transporter subunit PqiC [Ponticoccus sp. SC6-9]MBM1223367.1 membrane integrity-associated transporter subunit PqiC [Ponticoccus sp. SC6-15]MBM1229374.1 membrane integrity-associated transporter subunit PqiC [Ponticoccus sp. SC6-38]MBM1232333.1 membrane integrity-associated transporter subunit PqiC [Ponticoccus sp. SC6-45]MBM1237717.1 membrane integrity-associated trans